MKIELHQFTIGEVVEGYHDSDEEGVVGYGGRLNIRPKYQREFVYDPPKQMAVMDTVWKGFPLNVMYWVRNDDGTFELLDGQQRTLSICRFIAGEYMMTFDGTLRGWSNMNAEQQQRVLDYKLQIYVCEGTPSEQLDWFRIINIAGERLTNQELLNAIYSGSWVTHAKRRFSKNGCVAFKLAEKYMVGSTMRQAYLETALRWIAEAKYGKEDVRRYMAEHQHDGDSDELWQYFQEVFAWVFRLFPDYHKEMKGLDWGILYNRYKDNAYKSTYLQQRVGELMEDENVTDKAGIYEYLLGGEQATQLLSVRVFDDITKRKVYTRQTKEAQEQGVSNCPLCAIGHDANRTKIWSLKEMDADHVTAWSKGGATDIANCQMLCRTHNRAKGNR